MQPQSVLRAAITAAYRRPEPECVPLLLGQARMPNLDKIRAMATDLVKKLRGKRTGGGVEGLIQEFSLSSQEGVALMCLAEALLRIPDRATRDALIRDKVSRGDWKSHMGGSQSLFVNAATWGLMITGKLVAVNSEQSLSKALTRLIGKGGEPLVRKGVNMAMRMMGEQFVSGQTISEALANNRKMEARGFRYSYDMLGEAATTAEDADRYYASYEQAIHAIGKAAAGRGIYEGPGISIKLSALHPRYSRAQRERVMAELLPRVKALTALARSYDIGLNIDAEEADRLEISLDLLEALCFAPELDGWNGIGFVIQAYQKRAPFVIDYVIDLARRSRHRVMVRLVKGAYWDSEIKRAQVDGLEGYPVYTRKIYTDVAYLACARKLLGARGRVSAVRHAQRLHAVGHLSAGRPELLPRSVRVPVPARHGRAAVRRSGRPVGAGQAEPPVSHLCAGGHARDAAGLSGAPPAGEWRQHLVREPDRRREHSGRAAGVRSGGRRLARRAAGRAARRSRCRANSSATRRKARAPTPPAWT